MKDLLNRMWVWLMYVAYTVTIIAAGLILWPLTLAGGLWFGGWVFASEVANRISKYGDQINTEVNKEGMTFGAIAIISSAVIGLIEYYFHLIYFS